MKSSKTLFGVEQYKGSEEKEAEKEKAEELTKTLSHLPIYFGLLLEQAFMGTLPKSNMIEEGRQDSGVNGDKKPTSNNDGNHQGSTDTKRDGLKRDNHGAIRAMNYKYVNNSPVSMVGKQFGGYQHHVAKKTAFPKWDNDKIVEEIGTSDDENHISDEELDKSDKAKRVEHKLIEVIGTSKKTDAPAANEIDMTKKTMKTADEIGTTGKKYESVVDMDIDTGDKMHDCLLYQPYHRNLFDFYNF
jgi:hypothetical protein